MSFKIFPVLVGLITSVYMFRASGGIDILSDLLKPILDIIKIPPECAPLMILKPISGGGGMAIFSDILSEYGADSFIGRVSSVMMSASETSFYTISIYFGAMGIKKLGYTLPCVMLCDALAFILSAYFVRVFFNL